MPANQPPRCSAGGRQRFRCRVWQWGRGSMRGWQWADAVCSMRGLQWGLYSVGQMQCRGMTVGHIGVDGSGADAVRVHYLYITYTLSSFPPAVLWCLTNPPPTTTFLCPHRRSSHSEMNVEAWVGSQDQATADLTPSPARPDKLCLDSFWSEVETIRQGGSYSESDGARRDSKNSEGEVRAGAEQVNTPIIGHRYGVESTLLVRLFQSLTGLIQPEPVK